MHTSRTRFRARIGIASLALVLAAALFQPSAGAAPDHPTAPSGVAFSDAENFVNWVYDSVLFREPDPGGFTYWAALVEQHGAGPFVHAVVESEEWAEAWVDAFYEFIWLERVADDAGLAHWAAYVADHRFDSFESHLGGSQEAYDLSGGTDALYVDFVYFAAMFRDPTAGEMTEGLAALALVPRSDFVHSVLQTGDSLADRVNIVYDATLRRAPDPAGEEYWMGYYHRTGSMALMQAYMLLSPEAWETAQRGISMDDVESVFRR